MLSIHAWEINGNLVAGNSVRLACQDLYQAELDAQWSVVTSTPRLRKVMKTIENLRERSQVN